MAKHTAVFHWLKLDLKKEKELRETDNCHVFCEKKRKTLNEWMNERRTEELSSVWKRPPYSSIRFDSIHTKFPHHTYQQDMDLRKSLLTSTIYRYAYTFRAFTSEHISNIIRIGTFFIETCRQMLHITGTILSFRFLWLAAVTRSLSFPYLHFNRKHRTQIFLRLFQGGISFYDHFHQQKPVFLMPFCQFWWLKPILFLFLSLPSWDGVYFSMWY